jgi:hypothetical protein
MFSGFILIAFGLLIVLRKSFGRVYPDDISKLFPHGEVYLGAYALPLGGIFIALGIFLTYRAFTKN